MSGGIYLVGFFFPDEGSWKHLQLEGGDFEQYFDKVLSHERVIRAKCCERYPSDNQRLQAKITQTNITKCGSRWGGGDTPLASSFEAQKLTI